MGSRFSSNLIRTLTQRLQEERRSGVREVEELPKGLAVAQAEPLRMRRQIWLARLRNIPGRISLCSQ